MRIRERFVLFCIPTEEIYFVRFFKVLLKSNDLMREGIFNCILDYLYAYQKEGGGEGGRETLMAGSQHLRNLSLVTACLQSPCLPRR